MIRYLDIRSLFSPAVNLLNRLDYIRKFMLLGLMSLVAVTVVIYALYNSLDQTIRNSQRQLQGLELIKPISHAMHAIQLHRGISASLPGGGKTLQNRLASNGVEIDEAFGAIEQQLPHRLIFSENFQYAGNIWEQLRNYKSQETPNDSFALHTRLIEQLQIFEETIADEYALGLDSKLDTYYLIDTVVNKLPLTLEHLCQIRGFSADILASMRISELQGVKLRVMLGELDSSLRLLDINLNKIGRYNPALQAMLMSASLEVNALAQQVVNFSEADILAGSFTTPPEAFLDMVTTEIDKGYAQINTKLLPAAETLIRARLAKAKTTLYLSIAIALLLFVIVAYFAISNYLVIVDSLQSFARAAHDFAKGDLKARVRLDTRDELSDIAASFNKMANGFSSMLAAHEQAEKKILHMAHHDALTGLPNRELFQDRLEQEIRKAHRTGLKMALLYLDLDKFKEVNDTFGHGMGDTLLQEAARRIGRCVREADTVARLGGDEFTVILGELDHTNSVERVTGSILKTLAEPFYLGTEKSYVSASIGVTLYPDDATEAGELLQNADQAMYAAKTAGRNGFSYFTHSMQHTALTRLYMINELRDALAANQFKVHYQPIVDLADGRIGKAEALIRWQHPTLGMIRPAEFVPLAEETGLIVEIGEWVFKEAVHQLKAWRTLHNDHLQISVNVSPIQFGKNTENPCQAWFGYLRKIELPGQSMNIEITEGILLDTESGITGKLRECHEEGIQISIDDFGTGYSSLAYLKKFDIDYLKIDRSFVCDMANDPNDMALAEAIIVMAHKLGLKVVAEGVETEAQRRLLAEAGCDYGQGYLFSRPVPAEEFEALLKKQSGDPAPLAYSI